MISQIPRRNATRLQPLTVNFTFPDHSDVAVLEHIVVVATMGIENQDRIYTPNDLYQAKEEDRESIIFHTSARRGDIEITLTSPHQTKSTILPHRPRDFVNSIGFNEWPFMSVHFWGENPTGEWSLSIGFKSETGCVHLKNVKVMYYGTRTKPQSINTVPKTCSKECAKTTGCASSSPEDCDACNSYRDPVSLTCLPICPNSTIARNGYCIDQQNHFAYSYSISIHPTSSSSMKTSLYSTGTLTTYETSTEITALAAMATPTNGGTESVGNGLALTDSSQVPTSSAPSSGSRALSIYIIANFIVVLLLLYS